MGRPPTTLLERCQYQQLSVFFPLSSEAASAAGQRSVNTNAQRFKQVGIPKSKKLQRPPKDGEGICGEDGLLIHAWMTRGWPITTGQRPSRSLLLIFLRIGWVPCFSSCTCIFVGCWFVLSPRNERIGKGRLPFGRWTAHKGTAKVLSWIGGSNGFRNGWVVCWLSSDSCFLCDQTTVGLGSTGMRGRITNEGKTQHSKAKGELRPWIQQWGVESILLAMDTYPHYLLEAANISGRASTPGNWGKRGCGHRNNSVLLT